MPVFDIAEYKERVSKTKERMNREGIEVLLATDPANMNYLAGYDGDSFYVPQGLILKIDEEQPVWFGRGMDANGARITTWLKEENIRAYSDDYVQSSIKHPMNFVTNILKEKGRTNKIIGVEMDQCYFTARCLTELKKDLPNTVFKDATLLVNMVRQIKSEKEISYMKRAARIVERAIQVGIESIEAGVRQCDAAAKIYYAQISGTPEYGGDYVAGAPIMLTGKRASAAHLTWSDEKFHRNEVTILEIAGCYHRYHSPICRTVYVGNPPDKLKWVAEKSVEALEKALDAIKPGITCEEVEKHWRKAAMAEGGVARESSYHRLGYSIGLGYPPDWGEHTASMRPGDKTILQPNMTFHLIPSIWEEDCGFGISEAIRVTADGCETLANFPRRLFVK